MFVWFVMHKRLLSIQLGVPYSVKYLFSKQGKRHDNFDIFAVQSLITLSYLEADHIEYFYNTDLRVNPVSIHRPLQNGGKTRVSVTTLRQTQTTTKPNPAIIDKSARGSDVFVALLLSMLAE